MLIVEDNLATSKSAIVEMSADIHHKKEMMDEKLFEIANLTERLLLLNAESESRIYALIEVMKITFSRSPCW